MVFYGPFFQSDVFSINKRRISQEDCFLINQTATLVGGPTRLKNPTVLRTIDLFVQFVDDACVEYLDSAYIGREYIFLTFFTTLFNTINVTIQSQTFQE